MERSTSSTEAGSLRNCTRGTLIQNAPYRAAQSNAPRSQSQITTGRQPAAIAVYRREDTHSSPAGTRQKRARAICRAARTAAGALLAAPRFALLRRWRSPRRPPELRDRLSARAVQGGIGPSLSRSEGSMRTATRCGWLPTSSATAHRISLPAQQTSSDPAK